MNTLISIGLIGLALLQIDSACAQVPGRTDNAQPSPDAFASPARLSMPIVRRKTQPVPMDQQASAPPFATPTPVQPVATASALTLPQVPAKQTSASTKKPDFDVNSVYPPVRGDWQFDFSPTPLPPEASIYDAQESRRPYDDKKPVDVQRPLVELGRPFYLNGLLPRSNTFLGETNLIQQHFYVYGDYRRGYGGGRAAGGEFHNTASQLRLDIDWMFTSTERLHAFMTPLNRGGNFSGIDFRGGDIEFESAYNADFITAYFEGDLGAIYGGLTNDSFPFDLPITAGLVPLLYQNGIWMEDAVAGAAFAIPALNNKYLNWSNYDITFFAAVDQINSDAFGADDTAAQLLGTAWFIEAYEGYIETGYAYVRDRQEQRRSYHNFTLSYARRYWWRISNAIRVIANVGQDLPRAQRSADGALLLLENAWISHDSLRYVPYLNLFVGFRRPQSVARAGAAGAILRNTGINFESDNLNGYPTLDATARNTYGGALGFNLLGPKFDYQLVLEAAFVGVMENADDRNAPGSQAAVGLRYQLPLSDRTLIRIDGMYGFREHVDNISGGRIEYRWKF